MDPVAIFCMAWNVVVIDTMRAMSVSVVLLIFLWIFYADIKSMLDRMGT